MKSQSDDLYNSLKVLPASPGIYKFLNSEGSIIYIGKAKNLKKRVQSYFSKNSSNFKTSILVKSIHTIEHVIVDSETDALLLENNLIKSHQPKYNVLLKDDKTYPWIVIKNEPFPRIFSTRKKIKDGSSYFGPYTSVRHMNVLLNLIYEIYPIRSCKLELSEQKIREKKYVICLDYHIGKCKGPCENKQSEQSYNEIIEEAKLLLSGKTKSLISLLASRMQSLAENYEFEKANHVKKSIESIKKYTSKSIIVSNLKDLDVFTIIKKENTFYLNFMVIKEGSVVYAYSNKIKDQLNKTADEICSVQIDYLKEKFRSDNQTVLVNEKLNFEHPDYKFECPKIGVKKELILLSLKNVSAFILNQRKKAILQTANNNEQRILETIKKDFKLKSTPIHMECFDNSNFHGSFPVSACVVFKNGKPSKKDYRHFNVKTVEGPDDFATMKEVIYRRYKRLIDEKRTLPQLVIVDGGKGQLSAAVEALDSLGLRGEIPIVGIAKRLEEIFFPGDRFPIYLDKRSESLKVIQFMRNESHRFGIEHHRNRRSNAALHTAVDVIPGIGPKTVTLLFNAFKTIEGIKNADKSALIKIIGKHKTGLVQDFFKAPS
ncbi:excinuclease ABC subunit UvrC [Crocinitomicaceae bacterium]|nr:excinuclease ABC subunit UvrC [Crocinitomicaceae bacterium]